MPKIMKDRADALQYAEHLSASKRMPALVVTWDVEDIKSTYLDPDDNPILNDEQAVQVLGLLNKRYEGHTGITWGLIERFCDEVVPRCGSCGYAHGDCRCPFSGDE